MTLYPYPSTGAIGTSEGCEQIQMLMNIYNSVYSSTQCMMNNLQSCSEIWLRAGSEVKIAIHNCKYAKIDVHVKNDIRVVSFSQVTGESNKSMTDTIVNSVKNTLDAAHKAEKGWGGVDSGGKFGSLMTQNINSINFKKAISNTVHSSLMRVSVENKVDLDLYNVEVAEINIDKENYIDISSQMFARNVLSDILNTEAGREVKQYVETHQTQKSEGFPGFSVMGVMAGVFVIVAAVGYYLMKSGGGIVQGLGDPTQWPVIAAAIGAIVVLVMFVFSGWKSALVAGLVTMLVVGIMWVVFKKTTPTSMPVATREE